jgi:hypothetical protein
VHKPLFEKLIEAGLIDKIREQDTAKINTLLREVLGEGYEYEALLRSVT